MLQIGLLILKIIGWLILGILGLLTGILLLVLLVPIRYRFSVSKQEKIRGTLRVTWLLHMFLAAVSFEDEFQTEVRIFGRRMFQEKEDSQRVEADLAEGVREMAERTETVVEHAEPAGKDPVEDPVEDPKTPGEDKMAREKQRTGAAGKPKKTARAKRPQRKSLSIFERVKQKFADIRNKWNSIRAFFQNEANRATLKLMWKRLRKALRHLCPVKMKGFLTFGFDDPYVTGQVLAAASMCYGWYGKQIRITPVFEEEVLEGELEGRGRICLGFLLCQGVRILLDKNFRKLLKQWRNKGGVQYG